MKSDTFVVLSSMLESAKCLDDNLRNELCYVIMEYGFNGELVESSPIIKAIMMSIIPNINSSKSRYKASVDNGKLGGRPPKPKPNDNLDKPNDNLEETKPKPRPNLDKDKDKDKDVDKDIVKREVGFKKPTLDDLQNRISEMNYQVDAIKFFNYYESNGWKVGRNKMKCWKSALTTWNSNNDTKQQPKSFKQQDKEAIDSSIDNYYRMKEQGFNLQEELIKQAELEKKGNTYELN